MLKKTNSIKFMVAALVFAALSPLAFAQKASLKSHDGFRTISSENASASVFTMEIEADINGRFTSRPERPSIADILDSVNHGQIKFSSEEATKDWSFFKEFNINVDHLAKIIASFEKAYPGLTYVFLGRDSAFLADAIEAFYLSNGQVGRVRRLKASGNSIYDAQPATLMLFLRQNGFVPTSKGLSRPFIIIDRTSYDSGSQMKRLLEVGYTSLLAAGVNPQQAMRQFAGVHVGGDNVGVALTPHIEKDFFSNLMLLSERRLSPDQVLRIPAVGLIDRSFWQESYGKFNIDSSGRISALVGSPLSGFDRSKTFGEILWATAAVTTKKFREVVERTSRDMFNTEFRFGPQAKVSLPSDVLKSEATSESRLGAIEFLASYDGETDKRYHLARSLPINDPDLSEIAQKIVHLGDQKHLDIIQTSLLYIASLDLILGLTEKERSEIGDRALIAFEQRLDQLALLIMNSNVDRELPQFKPLLAASLMKGQGPRWDALRETLSKRWKFELQAEIENLEKPLVAQNNATKVSQKAVAGFRKTLAGMKRAFNRVIAPRDLVFPVVLNGTLGIMALTSGAFDAAAFASEIHAMGTYGLLINGLYVGLVVKNRILAKQAAQQAPNVVSLWSGPQLSSLTTNVGRYMEAIGVQPRARSCPAALNNK